MYPPSLKATGRCLKVSGEHDRQYIFPLWAVTSKKLSIWKKKKNICRWRVQSWRMILGLPKHIDDSTHRAWWFFSHKDVSKTKSLGAFEICRAPTVVLGCSSIFYICDQSGSLKPSDSSRSLLPTPHLISQKSNKGQSRGWFAQGIEHCHISPWPCPQESHSLTVTCCSQLYRC